MSKGDRPFSTELFRQHNNHFKVDQRVPDMKDIWTMNSSINNAIRGGRLIDLPVKLGLGMLSENTDLATTKEQDVIKIIPWFSAEFKSKLDLSNYYQLLF